MKTFPVLFVLAGLSTLLALPVSAGVERTVEKKFPVNPSGNLEVETSGGSIEVQSSKDSEVRVIAKKKFRTSSESEADEVEKRLTLTIEQNGNNVLASAKYERDGFFSGSTPVYVNFIVTVPESFSGKLKTSGGNVAVGNLDGTLYVRTSGGDIRLGKIGGAVDAGTSGGNVSLEAGAAATKLHTSGGNIVVGHVVGAADLETSGGDIKLESVENTVHASTSGGNVRAGIAGALKGDCDLRTSGGNITAIVDKSAAFRLDASTSGGGVHAEGITITIDKGGSGRSNLAGDVNGGGPLLKLRSSGGSLTLKTR